MRTVQTLAATYDQLQIDFATLEAFSHQLAQEIGDAPAITTATPRL